MAEGDSLWRLAKNYGITTDVKLPADGGQYRGQPLDADYIERNKAAQPELLRQLQKMIEQYRRANSGR